MASISTDKQGRRRITFVGTDGKRRAIYLGEASDRVAWTWRMKVESILEASSQAGVPLDDDTRRWLASLSVQNHRKLVRVGLATPIERPAAAPAAMGLDAFLDDYIAKRTDVKPATALVYGHTRRNLVTYFGKAKPLPDITPGDGDLWRLWLKDTEKLESNTVRRRCAIAKQFFRAALRRKLIPANPFEDMRGGVQANAQRGFFVTPEIAEKVLDKCPDHEWRLIFALCRYGGLRCPSELVGLRWEDVHEHRFLVHSPKTEHHQGRESRWVPIFPELRPYFEDSYQMREPGAVHVLSCRHASNTNLRTRLFKIIKRAGIKPWPKLFQNLRSTRETELARLYPLHLVCAWIGNSKAIAAKHYLQITDTDFEQASAGVADGNAPTTRQTTQQTPAQTSTAMQPAGEGEDDGEVYGAVPVGADQCGAADADLWAIRDSNP